MKNFLFYVIGATNVGKSTFLESVKKAYPTQVHLIEVGKWMREKYLPEYFKGQGAPEHTQKEALQMLFDSIKEGEMKQRRFILVDGQPRNVSQVREIHSRNGARFAREHAVIELVCNHEERERRLRARDLQPGALELGLVRLDRDVLDIHEVLLEFTHYTHHRFHTGRPNYSPLGAFQKVLKEYGQVEELEDDEDGAKLSGLK